jgi:hypothetical protein
MDALNVRARKAVETAHGGRIDWSQVYSNYTETAKHTAYASANRVPLFRTPHPVPLDRQLRVERLAAALANGTPRDKLIEMIDDDVLRRTGVDIRGKFYQNGETMPIRLTPISPKC